MTGIEQKAEKFSKKLVERDLKGIQNLLDFFNSLERSITKELNETNFDDKDITDLEKKFLEIDYNDKKLSSMEKELFSEIKNLGIKAKQVKFLNLLVEKLGNKNDSSKKLLDKNIEELNTEKSLLDAFSYVTKNSSYIDNDWGKLLETNINSLDSYNEIKNFQTEIFQKLNSLYPGKYIIKKEGKILKLVNLEEKYQKKFLEKRGDILKKIEQDIPIINDIFKLKELFQKLKKIDDKQLFFKKLNEFKKEAKNEIEKEDYIKTEIDKLPNKNDLEKLFNELKNKKNEEKFENILKEITKKIDEYKNSEKDLNLNKTLLENITKLGKKEKDITERLLNIQKKDNLYFLANPKNIYFLKNIKKVKEILGIFKSKNKQINLTDLNPDLWKKFITNSSIYIDYFVINNLTKDIIEDNFTGLLEKSMDINSGLTTDNLLNRALFLGFSKNDIKKEIEKYNKNYDKKIDLKDYNYLLDNNINLSKKEFNEITENLDNKNIKSWIENKNNIEEKKSIINYIIENFKNDKSLEKIYKILIENDYAGENSELLINSGYITFEAANILLNKSLDYIHFIASDFLEGENIDKIIEKLDKNTNFLILNYINIEKISLKQGLDLYSKMLQLRNGGDTSSFFYEPRIFMKLKNKLKIEDIKNLDIKNKTLLNELLKETNNAFDIGINEMIQGKNTYNQKIQKIKLTENIINNNIKNIENFNSYDEKLKGNIRELFEKGEYKQNKLEKNKELTNGDIYTNIINGLKEKYKNDENKNEKIKKDVKNITNALINFKIEENKNLEKTIPTEKINDEKLVKIDKKTKEKHLDNEKLNEKYKNYLNNLNKKDKEKYKENKNFFKEKFIKENFTDLTKQEQENIEKILENHKIIAEAKLVQTYIDDYIKYDGNLNILDFAKQKEEEKLNGLEKNNNTTQNLVNKNQDLNQISSGNYELKTDNGNIEITKDEAKMISQNEKAKENLVNFYNTFKNLNLLSVWKYREEISKSIGNVNINLSDDSLKSSELINFGNHILKFINNISPEENYFSQNKGISELNAEFRKFSGADSVISNEKKFDFAGRDRFEVLLRKNKIINENGKFEISKFKKYLK